MASSHDEAAEHLLEADEPGPPSLNRFETDDETSGLTEREHSKARRLLYISHFLSTWNSRLFEFGAFLFLATIYPRTLLPASIYALARAASAAILSPYLGSYIDTGNRLRVVRLSIVGQRVAVTISCILFFLMANVNHLRDDQLLSALLLALLSALACVEKLAWVLNTIAVERDWVVTVAGENDERLRLLNSQMRRIDLFCKLVGPLAIAFVNNASPSYAILVTGAMTLLSVLVEYFAIARVYNMVPALKLPKTTSQRPHSQHNLWTTIKEAVSGAVTYARHPAFLPSFSLALLYLTVLSFAGQMITYLLALGLSSGLIGVLRGVSAVFELSATWFAPKIMARIGPVRAGIWFINWEILCVAIACAFFWIDLSPAYTAIGTVSAVIASRVGLWGFDLSAQIIVQEEVELENRGTFSSQEFALQNIFEMLAFASTIVFPRPADFKYPATVSAIAVGIAGILYATFVRARRGHLIHLSQCVDRKGPHRNPHHWWQRIPNSSTE
ncbi:Solute carrier family 40 member 1 [Fulvia fulva]|uniref:Solute carrier family 40 member n=1 Tax=Passalora fulva TaxID=5499 RepID=A0A9Q8P2X9_PASFU|nr:Solute carrier family 40 member 1 [Fulvia fulva]KAK4634795.1 Solute carrier family 40 member 1 [Fulvia fulva]KAK4637892.1 Solute carrier family 40 member 1 [Fulvia fulva]UJO11147.1 Solute carrier family 40 member 1 [Fulvia fulva]WPV09761.1 Solute carrier family 40 member 1 [Fulvia fulva]WPV24670.1 Solute carrier family 40 member 1 [Fulvia fulva]